MQPLAKSSPSPGVAVFVKKNHRILSSNGYPEPWGEGMQEVVAGDVKQKEGTLWAVNFFQLPNIGEKSIH